MTLVDRYLARQMLIPVLGAVAALTAVAVLSQTLSALDVVVQHGQSPWVLLKITVLALPPLFSLILPISLFVGALIALNRLQTEQEVVICFAAGMSRWRVMAPAIRLAVLFGVISLFLNIWAQPFTFRLMRMEYFKVRTDLAASLVREGEFVEAGSGLTFYAKSVDQNGLLVQPFIHVQGAHGATVYAAQEGRITKQGNTPVVILRHGAQQEFSPSGVLNYLSFDQDVFDLSPFVKSDEVLRLKASDLWMHELLFPNLKYPWERKNQKRLLAEANSRLATPLYNLAFMMLALAGVLGGPFSRLGYGRRIAEVAAAAVLARVAGFGVEAASAASPWLNILQYLVPLIPVWWSARVLFRQKIGRYVPMASDQNLLPQAGAA
ncbi:MAG TPA: LptF/LptG family permease [Caulobacteraceae bacterium]|jgi:lipopolysaccharide export system permease protein|nr:LptF/LptG family permease [Caulobacteraceae bacterium]